LGRIVPKHLCVILGCEGPGISILGDGHLRSILGVKPDPSESKSHAGNNGVMGTGHARLNCKTEYYVIKRAPQGITELHPSGTLLLRLEGGAVTRGARGDQLGLTKLLQKNIFSSSARRGSLRTKMCSSSKKEECCRFKFWQRDESFPLRDSRAT